MLKKLKANFVKRTQQILFAQNLIQEIVKGRAKGRVKRTAKAQNSAALAILALPAPATLFSVLLQKASIKIAASFLHQHQPGQSLTAPRRGAPRTYKIMRTLSMCRLILITPAWAGIALAPQMKILI